MSVSAAAKLVGRHNFARAAVAVTVLAPTLRHLSPADARDFAAAALSGATEGVRHSGDEVQWAVVEAIVALHDRRIDILHGSAAERLRCSMQCLAIRPCGCRFRVPRRCTS